MQTSASPGLVPADPAREQAEVSRHGAALALPAALPQPGVECLGRPFQNHVHGFGLDFVTSERYTM